MKKSRIFILSPFKGNFWGFLKEGIEKSELVQPLSIKINLFRYLCSDIKILFTTSKNDVIVCPYDFQGVILWHLCNIFNFRRNIVAVNLLLKIKETRLNRIVRWLYKKAIDSKNFKVCVTSEEYGKYINKELRTNVVFPLIHDVNYEFYEFNSVCPKQKKTVFCGGRNGRDWSFMVTLAKYCNDISFIFVVPSNIYNNIKNNISANVSLYKDVSFKRFGELLTSSSVVCLPLDTEAPAGLMVLFQAASSRRFVITTDTVTTREYIQHGINGLLLENDIEMWSNALNYLINRPEECDKMVEELRDSLISNCSKQQYIDGIKSMIDSFHINSEDN